MKQNDFKRLRKDDNSTQSSGQIAYGENKTQNASQVVTQSRLSKEEWRTKKLRKLIIVIKSNF